jgi:hypothetical protein
MKLRWPAAANLTVARRFFPLPERAMILPGLLGVGDRHALDKIVGRVAGGLNRRGAGELGGGCDLGGGQAPTGRRFAGRRGDHAGFKVAGVKPYVM